MGRTREALLEQGALLFARRGVGGVTARELHDAVGARNESALHYHFGGKDGLVLAILRGHLDAVEARRGRLVAAIEADDRRGDVRRLVHALAAPMADDLPTPLGRAHLRLVDQVSHPSLAYDAPFRVTEAPAGAAVVRWLWQATADLPGPIRLERLRALREQLISLFARRAQLIDDTPADAAPALGLFLPNLIDSLVAGLRAMPSPEAVAAATVAAGSDA
jgi:AcrR family transcriptional regulator